MFNKSRRLFLSGAASLASTAALAAISGTLTPQIGGGIDNNFDGGVIGGASSGPVVLPMDFIFSDVASWASYHLQPDSIYLAAIDTTVWFEQTVLSFSLGTRAIWCKGRIEATGAIIGPYFVMSANVIANDVHGLPIPGYDANTGYLYISGGSHATPLALAKTASPNNITSWVTLAALAGQHTYPKYMVATAGVNAGQHSICTRNNSSLDFQLQLTLSTAIAGDGTPTWGTSNVIFDLGPDARVDAGPHLMHSDGHTVWGCFTRPNNADTIRQDVWVYLYDFSDGKIYNVDRSFSTATFPIDYTTAANFIVVNQHIVSHEGNVPAANFDSAGGYHILYMDGPSGGPYNALHQKYIGPTKTDWTAPVVVGQFATLPTAATHRFDGMAVVPLPAGALDLYWVTQGALSFARGGDIVKVTRTAAGVFGAQTPVRSPDGPTFGLDAPSPILNASPKARVHFGETNGDETLDTGRLHGYSYGDSGPAKSDYSTISKSLFASLQPLTVQKPFIDEFINTLDQLGIWSAKMELFHLALNDFTSGSINWANPGNFTLTQIGAPTFTALDSFKGDGTATKFNTGFVPSVNATKSSLNSTAIGYWITGTTLSNDTYFDYGAIGGGFNTIGNARNATNSLFRGTVANATNNNYGAINSDLGFHILSRTASNLMTHYRNGVADGTNTAVSTGVPTGAVHIGGTTAGSSARKLALAFHCSGLTATDAAVLWNSILKLRSALQMT